MNAAVADSLDVFHMCEIATICGARHLGKVTRLLLRETNEIVDLTAAYELCSRRAAPFE